VAGFYFLFFAANCHIRRPQPLMEKKGSRWSPAKDGLMAETGVFEGDLQQGRHVVTLRSALRNSAESSDVGTRSLAAVTADQSADLLIERCYQPLLRYCESLVRSSSALRDRVEGADIAQDAWTKVLRYLRGDQGERIHDDEHFFRLLRSAARTRFLDLLSSQRASTRTLEIVELDAPELSAGGERLSGTRGDRVPGNAIVPDVLQFGADGRYQTMIELLFGDEAGFRRSSRKPIRRRLPQYRAYVLYQLGLHFLREAFDPEDPSDCRDPGVARLMRRFVDLLGVPAGWWSAVEEEIESAVERRATEETVHATLLNVVNGLCGAALQSGNPLAVLRYELNGYVNG
jgi:hypothetical protein